ncbi:30S ribosomal protein S16 [bacterium]|nr:30S ribosomal protein S16 [bacterium]
MAVRIRLKQLGRKHRMYYRICVMDSRTPRDGKTIEEIGTYDPMIRDTDKRVTLDGSRYDYWVSVGAKPTDQVARLAEKYKGHVPTVRIDVPKPRDIALIPVRTSARRVKIEPPAPPAPEPVAEVAVEAAPEAAPEAPVAESGETPAAT